MGSGLLIPTDSALPPLAIDSHRVDVTIDRQIATTHVEQVFINHTNRDLEAKYVFPLPPNAAIREFSMVIGGKTVKGELLKKDEAAQIYESIVARMRDPGLLEYLGNNLFRVRVYPVVKKSKQKIELTYSESVASHGGLLQYVYPLRTGQKASQTMKDFTVRAAIKSAIPIKSVYSPSHQEQISIRRESDGEAVVGMEMARYTLDQDFQLFYTVSDKDFGLDLACFRPDPAKPGYFMMLISPKSRINADERVPRDFCFVFDTSGSMRGDKIEQARRALKYCIDNLNDDDRFNMVAFSTHAESFSKEMLEATPENRKKAAGFIEKLEARGGTNIHDALKTALAIPHDADRQRVIAFMTDGLPTIGETNPKRIVPIVKAKGAEKDRIFAFGVGDDVNTHLLDRISGMTGGATEYVREGEAIDLKVSQFFDKASHPVLTEVKLDLPDSVEVKDVYPRDLGDLYRGSQVTVFGRYSKPGHVAVSLGGRLKTGEEKFVYECTFPEAAKENGFIEPIWAHRKIGYLLDQIRLHGENKELVDEVTRLGTEYSIQTPYTSYLVLPDAERKLAGLPVRRERELVSDPRRASRARKRRARMTPYSRINRIGGGMGGAERRDNTPGMMMGGPEGMMGVQAMKAKSGKKAVNAARRLKEYKGRESRGGKDRAAMRKVLGRKFYRIDNVWIDEKFKEGTEILEIKFPSKAYFALVRRKEIRDALKLGEYVVVVTPSGKAIAIGDDGKAKLSKAEVDDLMKKPKK
jgi:Ca-activated chloride channel family protein